MKEENQKAKKPQKPRWWKPFWILVIISNLLSLLITYIFFRDSFLRIFIFALLFLPVLGLAYYFRVHPSKKFNKGVYILAGASWLWALIFFGTVFLIWLFNLPPPVDVIGPQLFLLFFFILTPIIGGILGVLIGKRKNYRIPFSLEYNENQNKNAE